jgi:hypothetical protein
MKKMLLAGIAALSVLASAAHAQQGNLPKPVRPLPPYPPLVCVTPDWKSEPCEGRKSTVQASEHRSEWQCYKDISVRVVFDEATTPPSIQYSVTGIDASTNHFRYFPTKDELYLNGRLCAQKTTVFQNKHKTVLYNETGGNLQEHLKRWQALASSGDGVEIRGVCPSGCTMIMAYVPSDRLCFGESASLQFHAARNANTGEPSVSVTQWMINQYPQDIRAWIIAKGGTDKMTILQLWTLSAEELWKMGYRKCEPEASPVPMTQHRAGQKAAEEEQRGAKR